MLNTEQKQKLVEEIKKKVPNLTCPMCQNKNFVLADGYFNNTIQTDLKTFGIGGPSVPTIGIVCTNCGFVSQHALGVLGLLPKEEKKSDAK